MKSKEDILIECGKKHGQIGNNFDQFTAIAAMEEYALQFQDKWINVNDALPKHDQLVACYRDIESKQIFVTNWSDEDEKYYQLNEVTHWIPLLEPPKIKKV